MFRSLVEHSPDLMCVFDAEGRLRYACPGATRLLGSLAEEAEPTRLRAHPDDEPKAVQLWRQVLRAGPGEGTCEQLRVLTAGAEVSWLQVQAYNHLNTAGVGAVLFYAHDVSEEERVRQQLATDAMHDALTGLPNRRWFTEALDHALGRTARSGRAVGLLLIDVDHFKDLNDAHGHPAGDELLIALAQRMSRCVRPADTVCRLGGDEFVVLVEDLHHDADVIALAQRLSAGVSGLYHLANGMDGEVEAAVTLSVGVAAVTSGGADALLAAADSALYEAKRRGRNRVEAYDPALRRHVLHRLSMERQLRQALSADELVLHFQPIFRARDEVITGAEALLRWQHPERGLLPPAAFLPLAQDAGLMPEVCDWVLHHATAQAGAWAQVLPEPLRVFINLDRHQLTDAHLPVLLAAIAAEEHADADSITLELSERLLSEDLLQVRGLLRRIRDLGMGIALDDFGAGNTALTWLQQLPLDLLKLDRRFTLDLDQPASRSIVRAVLNLAPELGIDTLAEGVETAQQSSALTWLGCDYLQGFHLARPQTADQLTTLLTT
ncbi:PAS domain S-box-containing protein/diguanylate cyclase (GGDEF)-like protein [Kineococcus xinjiangensis]|uniref:PAS domain S-box-containing protein/diguanylate cyclase (GGDEF)-like protein n=1 Tax=Kineococcus xinjiangensis TaxID=512762 RepID=A0A2S6IKI4_9ACTN|nr:EAL domain-containing protein [Kineococcus xinjiangensis]PPK94742.1 PAS domain S-box-containing protein/diguanylate cyclase (GGDEF)-like protein [Kineococcus xinjiangensis]